MESHSNRGGKGVAIIAALCSAFLFFSTLATNLSAAEEIHKRGGSARSGLDASGLPADAHELKIGDAAPDFSLKGVDGKIYTLANFKSARLLMVVFLSNHCPYSHAAEA